MHESCRHRAQSVGRGEKYVDRICLSLFFQELRMYTQQHLLSLPTSEGFSAVFFLNSVTPSLNVLWC